MMRLIKGFLFVIAGLFIMITLVSLLITPNVRVSRSTVISNTTVPKIYAQVANLKNWKNWHPMFKPGLATITYNGIDSGKNAACDIVYNGKKTHLTITAVNDSSVRFSLQAANENDIDNQLSFTPVTEAKDIQVEWKALTKVHWYPWEKFYAIFIDKISGPGYETALSGLKTFMDKSGN